jgi:hypothetical protein
MPFDLDLHLDLHFVSLARRSAMLAYGRVDQALTRAKCPCRRPATGALVDLGSRA